MFGNKNNIHWEIKKPWDGYEDLFDLIPCLITIHDKNYRIIKYNHAFAEKFDPKPNSYCYKAYKGRDTKCAFCPVEKTFQDGKSHRSEETGVNKDGTITHWITRTSPIKNSAGEIIAAMEMNLDVTPSKELEIKLARSEKKYQSIFNNIPNPVFVLDDNTLGIIDCNKMVHKVYGFHKHELAGKSFLDLFEDKNRKEYETKIRSSQVINSAKHLNHDGMTLYTDIWISPLEYPGEKGFLVTTNDITQRLETEQQLIQASKMATLGEMASGVAHELNQPLSVIKTISSFFLKKIKKDEDIPDETLTEMLIKVDHNVDRASTIINHMRQFSRKSEMELSKIDINEIIRKTCEIFKQQLKVRGIDLELEPTPEISKAMADPGLLEQIFVNLIVNARDAIEKKWEDLGSPSENDAIIFRTFEDDHFIIAEVQDSGEGVPPKLLEKIFEPFFTTKEVGKGTGLGLSITYNILKVMGGSIEAVSPPGQGACFKIRLPKQLS